MSAPKIQRIEFAPSQGPLVTHAWECNLHANEAASGSSESLARPGIVPVEGLGFDLNLAAIHPCFTGLEQRVGCGEKKRPCDEATLEV